MPLVYNKFKIDSTRFDKSNYYYMSKIDLYQKILEDAVENIEARNTVYKDLKTKLDSIRKDSLDRIRDKQKRLDSLKLVGKLDTLATGKVLDEIITRE